MDIYQALKNDHDELKPLLDQLIASADQDNDERKDLLNQIRDELIPHARAEEAVFYNSLREVDFTKEEVRHAYQEHMEAEGMLRTLQAGSMIGMEFKKLAEKFRDALLHHIEDEETRIFQVAQQVLTDEESHQMATAFERMKPEIREEGIMKNTLDMVANMMPKRFSESLRSFRSDRSERRT